MIQVKNSVRGLKPYFVNDITYKVKLDANEGINFLLQDSIKFDETFNPNIYPDSDAKQLRKNMAKYYKCQTKNIIVGNGSSDLINMIINAYCEKGDKVLSFSPTFSMYSIYCSLCSAEYITIPVNNDLTQNIDDLISKAADIKPKIVIICTPNNPTGFVTNKKDIIKALDNIYDSIVIVDEAYIDFCGESSIDLINKYENLIVMRTLSKAFGLAGLRIGCLISNKDLVVDLWRVKFPYNINMVSQYLANRAFEKIDLIDRFVKDTEKRRNRLRIELENMGFTVYNSGANFLFVKSNIDNLFEKLNSRGILIRSFDKVIKNSYRISIGSKEEIDILISNLKEIIENEKK